MNPIISYFLGIISVFFILSDALFTKHLSFSEFEKTLHANNISSITLNKQTYSAEVRAIVCKFDCFDY